MVCLKGKLNFWENSLVCDVSILCKENQVILDSFEMWRASLCVEMCEHFCFKPFLSQYNCWYVGISNWIIDLHHSYNGWIDRTKLIQQLHHINLWWIKNDSQIYIFSNFFHNCAAWLIEIKYLSIEKNNSYDSSSVQHERYHQKGILL